MKNAWHIKLKTARALLAAEGKLTERKALEYRD
jgi:hypothetical protein